MNLNIPSPEVHNASANENLTPAGSPPAGDIPLRQMKSRPTQSGAGSMQQDGAQLPPPDASSPLSQQPRAPQGHSGEHPANNALSQPLGLQLKDKGRLDVSADSTHHPYANMIKATLGRSQYLYQSLAANKDQTTDVLLDAKGRLFSLQSSELALIGVGSSKANDAWRHRIDLSLSGKTKKMLSSGNPQYQLALDDRAGQVSVGQAGPVRPGAAPRQTTQVALPDSAIREKLTGIFSHTNAEGEPEQLRLHNDKLYRYDTADKSWQSDPEHDEALSLLSRQGDGHLYAVSDKHRLADLTSGKNSAVFKDNVTGFTTHADGQTLILLTNEKTKAQSVKLIAALDSTTQERTNLTLKAGDGNGSSPFHALAVALHGDTLYACNSDGKVYGADRPRPGEPELLLSPLPALTRALSEPLGEQHRVSGFITNGDGTLHALVKDTRNQEHACRLDHSQTFKPGWNLSDSLVIDRQSGLRQWDPKDAEIVELGRLGRLTLHDGKVHFFDKITQRWEASDEKADRLKSGLDSNPWILKDGQIKKLNLNDTSGDISHASNVFNIRQARNTVSAALASPGLRKEDNATTLAVMDNTCYVAQTEKGELQVHHVNPGARNEAKLMHMLPNQGLNMLPAANGHSRLADLEINHQKNLFALNEQGELFTMAADEWQNPNPASAWHPVSLPAAAGLGKSSALLADENHQLKISDEEQNTAYLTQDDEQNSYLLNGRGELYTRGAQSPEGDWQHVPLNTEIELADLVTVRIDKSNHVMVTDKDGKMARLRQGNWAAITDPHADRAVFDMEGKERRFGRLLESGGHVMKGTGITLKLERDILGSTGQPGTKAITPFKTRIRAFLFKPTLEVPRPFKAAGGAIQHQAVGRHGLDAIYQEQGRLFSELKQLNTDIARQPPRQDLAGRLGALAIEDKSWPPFLAKIKGFSDEIDESAFHHIALLGQHHGVIDSHRQEIDDGHFTPKNKHSGRFNPSSSGVDLTAGLKNIFTHFPANETNHAKQVLDSMTKRETAMSHQKEHIPMGRNRDPSDDMNLAKSRAILDGLLLKALHEFVDRLQGHTEPYRTANMCAAIKSGYPSADVQKLAVGEMTPLMSQLSTEEGRQRAHRLLSDLERGLPDMAKECLTLADMGLLAANLASQEKKPGAGRQAGEQDIQHNLPQIVAQSLPPDDLSALAHLLSTDRARLKMQQSLAAIKAFCPDTLYQNLMLSELHEVIDREEWTDKAQTPQTLIPLEQAFRALRDQTYGLNPVKKASSQGFINDNALEKSYDAIKSMTHAFKKEDHGVNVTARSVMKANSQEDLVVKLKDTALSLDSNENISFRRTYGASSNSLFIPGQAALGMVGGRANIDREYGLSFSRADYGINVSFDRNGGVSGTLFGVAGFNPLDLSDDGHDFDSGWQLSPTFRANGILSLTLQNQMQNNVTFNLSEAELPGFIDALASGSLNPLELLDKGIDHRVKNGTTMSFDVDANFSLIGGFAVTGPQHKDAPTIRALVALTASANLFSATRAQDSTQGDSTLQISRTVNRARMMNIVSLKANAAGAFGSVTQPAENLRIPVVAAFNIGIQASVDNRTRQNVSMDFTTPTPAEDVQLDKLTQSLGEAFKDQDSQQFLASLNGKNPPALSPVAQGKQPARNAGASVGAPEQADDALTPEQKLQRLATRFLPMGEAGGLDIPQYAALRDLKRNLNQQTAINQHMQLLDNIEYKTTYNNLSKIDSNNLMHLLHKLGSQDLPASNAELIGGLMADNPRLKEDIRGFQHAQDTQAVVTLELKDSMKEQIAQQWLNNEIDTREVITRLKTRANMRVKSIAFTRNEIKRDGIASPTFIIGASNGASVSMNKNLGTFTFGYGEDQDTPMACVLSGDIAKASSQDAETLARAQEGGTVLHP
ncbi:AvrE-family type 3 secretion system effector [Sodalis sp. dw_96]|uniref:AvrE-family type 3 secretion system effector n=1 Tax=Sodalis sp. dw_96 TaxID=2719794 RepID=UPI001BD4AD7A|nr:AvrE-family type 3 secretion system effector [Sodalis sp. dw_96]